MEQALKMPVITASALWAAKAESDGKISFG